MPLGNSSTDSFTFQFELLSSNATVDRGEGRMGWGCGCGGAVMDVADEDEGIVAAKEGRKEAWKFGLLARYRRVMRESAAISAHHGVWKKSERGRVWSSIIRRCDFPQARKGASLVWLMEIHLPVKRSMLEVKLLESEQHVLRRSPTERKTNKHQLFRKLPQFPPPPPPSHMSDPPISRCKGERERERAANMVLKTGPMAQSPTAAALARL